MRHSFLARHPSTLIFIACLALFTLIVTLLSQAYGADVISTSMVKTLGKTLCLCLIALAMDLVWGYAGILSLGHGLYFALGGYAFGMYLMRQIGRDGEPVCADCVNAISPAVCMRVKHP